MVKTVWVVAFLWVVILVVGGSDGLVVVVFFPLPVEVVRVAVRICDCPGRG